MKRYTSFLFLLFLSAFTSNAKDIDAGKFSVNNKNGFTENKGQIIDQNNFPNTSVLFLWNGNGLNVQLRKTGFSYDVWKKAVSHQTLAVSKKEFPERKFPIHNDQFPICDSIYFHRIDFEFENANSNMKVISEGASEDYTNYYTTGTSEEGATMVRNYQKIIYKNIWNGIDIEFVLTPSRSPQVEMGAAHREGTSLSSGGEGRGEEGFKYNIIIQPFAKISDIKFRINGADNISLNNGNLILKNSINDITESIPYSYQINNENQKQEINSSFNIQNSTFNIYGLSAANYDPTKPLIIDPIPYLLWGTYYGGNGYDQGSEITTDPIGNVIVTGSTQSSSNIATIGAYQTVYAGNYDVVIVKMNSNGIRIWATYYGGIGNDWGMGIRTDTSGNIFTIGTTNSNGIASVGAYQTLINGSQNASFILKLNVAGARQWATYFGGNQGEQGNAIAIDNIGNICITGLTSSTVNISTTGAYQNTFGGGVDDAFVAKFSSSGNMQWATYYGGSYEDAGYGITCDTNGNIYVTGTTSSSGIATNAAYQTTISGSYDGFIAKFSSSGIRQWATYYGGSGVEQALGISTDINGNIFVTGSTQSTSGIATIGSYQTVLSGNQDAFIAKFNASGTRQWATYYGGLGVEQALGISTDINGNIIITGHTNSLNSIASTGAYQQTYGGGSHDVFIASFNSSGSRIWSSYYGGNGTDYGNGIATDANGKVYFTGITNSVAGIATLNSYQDTFGGNNDAFIGKFGNCANSYLNVPSASVVCARRNIQFTVSSSGIFFKWSGPNGYISLQENAQIINANQLNAGVYSLLMLDSANGCTDSASVNLTVLPTPVTGFIQNNFSECFAGNSFQFYDSSSVSSGTIRRLWRFSNGDTSTSFEAIKSFSVPGIYTVTLIETAGAGCKDSVTKTITVYPQTNIGFTINQPNQCSQNGFLFTDTSSVSSGTFTRFWKLGNGDTSTASVINKSYISGTYQVKLMTTTNNNCVDSVQQNISVSSYPKPNAGFTQNNFAQCLSGNDFILNDTSSISSGTISRLWSFGDSTNSVNSVLDKIFSKAGSYAVKLIETSDHNCLDSVTKIFTVYPQPKAGFTQNSFNACLSRNNFVLNDTSSISSGTLLRLWKFNDGDTSTSLSINKIFTSSGSFLIKLFETSDHNCIDSSIKTVTVYQQPQTGFIQNNLSECLSGNNFVLHDTSTISSGTMTRFWDFGDSTTSVNNNLNKNFSFAGTYAIKLFETSDHNCIDSAIKIVTVYPQPKSGFTQNNFVQCLSGNNFILNDTSTIISGTMTRVWNFGDATTSSANPINKNYAKEGSYSVKLLLTSNNNCSDSLTKSFTVYPHTNIGFTVNNLNQCLSGNNYLFTDTSVISSGTFSRLWNLGDGNSSAAKVISRSYNADGSYLIKLNTTTNNGCIDSVQKIIQVYPKPVAGFMIQDSIQCFTANNFFVEDTSLVASGTYNRYWDLGDTTTSTIARFNKSYTSSGKYEIQLRIVDANKCIDSVMHSIIVKASPEKPHIRLVTKTQIEALFSPNTYQWLLNNTAIENSNSQSIYIHQNGIYKVKVDSANGCSNSSDPISITLFNDAQLFIYPNPNTGKFIIDFIELPGEKNISIYNMQGKLLSEYNTSENLLNIELPFASGMYLLKAETSSGTYNAKVVVE